jgi:hypothetical protein
VSKVRSLTTALAYSFSVYDGLGILFLGFERSFKVEEGRPVFLLEIFRQLSIRHKRVHKFIRTLGTYKAPIHSIVVVLPGLSIVSIVKTMNMTIGLQGSTLALSLSLGSEVGRWRGAKLSLRLSHFGEEGG